MPSSARIRSRLGSSSVARKTSQRRERRAERRREHADLRLLEPGAREGEVGDQERDGEPDPRDGAAARDRGPADRGAQAATAQPGDERGDADDRDRLAREVADEDPERHRRRVRVGEEAAGERDARVREREERHDRVARPRVPELEQPLVRRDRGGDADLRRAGELRRRLLAEEPEEVGCALEVAARRRVGVRHEPKRKADDDRVDARALERDPGRRAEGRVDEPRPDAGGADGEDGGEDPGGREQRPDREVARVGERDHGERDEVVDDRDREQERAQPVGEPPPEQSEHPERERGVGRHRGAPAVSRRLAGVEGEEDRDRQHHPAEPGQERQREAAAVSQLAEVELAPRLEPDDEEEERHQAAVHPVAQVEPEPVPAEPQLEPGRPDAVVGAGVDVRPRERGHGRGEEHARAAGLRAHEPAQRGLEAARPGRPSRVGGIAHPTGEAIRTRSRYLLHGTCQNVLLFSKAWLERAFVST